MVGVQHTHRGLSLRHLGCVWFNQQPSQVGTEASPSHLCAELNEPWLRRRSVHSEGNGRVRTPKGDLPAHLGSVGAA